MKSSNNKYLKVRKGVVLSTVLDNKISEIDSYWEGRSEEVTSGVRDADDQIRIIRKYLVAKGLDKKYPEAMICGIKEKDKNGNYVWQMAWSNLLHIGVIINPPVAAICLMDYVRSGINKKGKLIGPSVHFKGFALDISGTDSLDIVKKLLVDKKIKSYLLERENNCIHIDI